MADTFPQRIRQAIGDPGSITTRKPVEPKNDGLPERTHESLISWQTSAVLQVVDEHRPRQAGQPVVKAPLGVALLIAFNSLATFVGGLWLGAVWL